ncbi:SMC-Scp complex subunit ScpB [Plantactinospora sp. WMMB334]|uniref:SMC-Scp complex subunit ScpB n=1 Tax=Plantactinospora sp. WMMB334 TaxID=3404119 RepID=UPI003B936577
MTGEEQPDSLAEQAAAWVPPWERPAATRLPQPSAEPADPSTDPADFSDGVEDSSAPFEVVPEVEVVSEVEVPEVEAPAADRTGWEPGAGERGAQPGEAVDVPGDAGMEPEGEPAAVPVPGGAGRRATALALVDDAELRGALEAILLVVDEPVTEIVLAQVLEQPTGRVAAALAELAAGYTSAGHGFELRRAAGGWRLYTRPEYAAYVERFVLDGQSVRLTQAALETLAVVAYKQPVTRSRISAIRGVNCDGVIRTLVSRGLIEECGTEPESGAFLYRTTTLFLEKLGLDTVAQLPSLAPFLPDDVEEIADAPR